MSEPAGATLARPARPKKSLGQHFLVDRGVRARIIEAAELSAGDHVVEIGAGRGFLTRALVERAGRVVAVEMDEALAERLESSLGTPPGLQVVIGDARQVDIDALVDGGSPYKLVANLPYYAATPIIRRFLEAEHKPDRIVVMVQREVARTMVAGPGKMGLLSVATQVYGTPRIVCYAPPRAFKPAPNVTSAVVRIDVYPRPALPAGPPDRFFGVVRAGFSAPRKQLRNSLGGGLAISPAAAESILARAGIDRTRRAQTLDLDEWARLDEAVRAELGAE